MKVFIAGATGAIGRPLVERLLAAGHQVIALTRTPNASHSLTKQGVQTQKADVLDAKALHAAVAHTRPDAVINQLTS